MHAQRIQMPTIIATLWHIEPTRLGKGGGLHRRRQRRAIRIVRPIRIANAIIGSRAKVRHREPVVALVLHHDARSHGEVVVDLDGQARCNA